MRLMLQIMQHATKAGLEMPASQSPKRGHNLEMAGEKLIFRPVMSKVKWQAKFYTDGFISFAYHVLVFLVVRSLALRK